jgi:tetratricopeptide (TPR) repeat protein
MLRLASAPFFQGDSMKSFLIVPLTALVAWCGSTPTPAEFAIQNARTEVAQQPEYFAGYNHLAMAYARRARETNDASFYAQAEETLRKSLTLSPNNYDGRKTGVFIHLGQHDWPAALDAAKKLNKEVPDDVSVYGYIADAEIALGDYKDAVEQTQWMLNLRPGNAPGLLRAGRLREVYKDWNGALEVLQMAYDATPFAESEERAWVLVQMARVSLQAGDVKSAEQNANEALQIFPRYHLAQAALTEIHAAPENAIAKL